MLVDDPQHQPLRTCQAALPVHQIRCAPQQMFDRPQQPHEVETLVELETMWLCNCGHRNEQLSNHHATRQIGREPEASPPGTSRASRSRSTMRDTFITDIEPRQGAEAHDIERWASLAAASAVMAYGLSRRSVGGLCLMAAATPLAYRGLSGHWPRVGDGAPSNGDTRAALSGDRGVVVREAIRLEEPIAEVYRFWRHFENLPRFMKHLERVTELGNGRSHWVACGPGGMRVEWDAEIINEIENKVIGWRSLPGADVISA